MFFKKSNIIRTFVLSRIFHSTLTSVKFPRYINLLNSPYDDLIRQKRLLLVNVLTILKIKQIKSSNVITHYLQLKKYGQKYFNIIICLLKIITFQENAIFSIKCGVPSHKVLVLLLLNLIKHRWATEMVCYFVDIWVS